MSAGATALQRQFTVHVVDDDASIRSALSRLFRASGHSVKTFESAQDYLAEASPEEPGCVVLDIRMPGMDGLTLQERMSDQGFEAPIVFVSAHGDVAASVRAMKHGAVDFLEKPFEEDDLLGAVDRAIALDGELRQRRMEERSLHVHRVVAPTALLRRSDHPRSSQVTHDPPHTTPRQRHRVCDGIDAADCS